MFRLFARTMTVLALVVLASCAAERQFGQIHSFEAEKKLGEEQLPGFLLSRGGVYSDARLDRYLNEITGRLVATVDVPEAYRPLRVRVLNTNSPSAFALPGGAIFLSRGIIAFANEEAQVAGVIAHEISHVIARHSAKRIAANEQRILDIVRQQDQSLRGAPRSRQIAIFERELEARLDDITSYSKDQELEADRLGLQMLVAAGYDPNGFGDLLARIEAQEVRRIARSGVSAEEIEAITARSGYPKLSERLAALGTFPAVEKAPAGRERLMGVIDGITFDDRYAGGAFVRDGRYWHRGKRVSFDVPSEIVPTHGDAFRMSSKYGRIEFHIEDADDITLDAIVKRLQAAEEQPLNAKRTSFNGFPAFTGSIRFNQLGDEFFSELAIIDLDGHFAIFSLLTKPEDERGVRPQFSKILNSVRRVSFNEAPKRRRYRTRRVQGGDSVSSLLADSEFNQDGEVEFRLLNGLDTGQPVTVDDWIKLIK